MVALGIPYGLAVLALRGVRSPRSAPDAAGPILREAWRGLGYVWRNRTLRGLAISMSARTFAGGIVVIIVPVIVLRQLGGSELSVGIALACSGVAGLLSAMVMGRIDSRGRERRLMALPLLATGPAMALLLLPAGGFGSPEPLIGFAIVCLVMVLMGLLDGPLDIGLFTLRQRRTPTAWIGRAFAISMSFNAVGYPVGSAVAGFISETSLSLAVILAAVTTPIAAVLVIRLVPRADPAAEAEAEAASGPSAVMAPAAGASEGSPARPAP